MAIEMAPSAVASEFFLDRCDAVPALIGRHEDFLIVSGLAGTSRDVAALTRDGAHTCTMAGAMGGACMIGLGLALARPERRVLVVTGDGELLMNVGALATIAVINPPNLAVICVDNGHYGETGYQKSHTSFGVDPEKIAAPRSTDILMPFTRPAGDGTYEVLVPLSGHQAPLILPYSFSSEEDCKLWLTSAKGSRRIEKARVCFE